MSLEDEIFDLHAPRLARWLMRRAAVRGRPLSPHLVGASFRRAQRAAERLHSRIRRDLLKADEHLETALAFSGRPE